MIKKYTTSFINGNDHRYKKKHSKGQDITMYKTKTI